MARKPADTASAPDTAATHETDPETGEVLSTARGLQRTAGFGDHAGAAFRTVKYVSVPMLEVPPGVAFYCQFVDKARILPPIEGYKSKFKGDHWASTIRAPNGEVRLISWGVVLKNEMETAYPDDSYVGKWFQMTLIKKPRVDYNSWAITEVEPAG